MRKRLKDLITEILGYKEELIFKENGKKLIVKMPDIEYESITNNHKLKIKKDIQELIHQYLDKKHKTTKDKKFSINKNRINVIVFPGSTYIVLQILAKAQAGELSETDKDMLEYHNFMAILRGGKTQSENLILLPIILNLEDKNLNFLSNYKILLMECIIDTF